jgi:hypothetical protein
LTDGKGPAINVSKSGLSLSLPLGPLSVNLSSGGIFLSLSPLKGSGLTLQEKIKL